MYAGEWYAEHLKDNNYKDISEEGQEVGFFSHIFRYSLLKSL